MISPWQITYISSVVTQIIREVLLFEKIAVTYCSYSIFKKSSQIMFYLFFMKPEILSEGLLISSLSLSHGGVKKMGFILNGMMV